jgi:hypothetical protein
MDRRGFLGSILAAIAMPMRGASIGVPLTVGAIMSIDEELEAIYGEPLVGHVLAIEKCPLWSLLPKTRGFQDAAPET